MAFWWVNQGITYKAERVGGYLWAPKRDKRGAELHHWNTMLDVREGDVIFSYEAQAIRAVSVALRSSIDCPRPDDLGTGEEWESEGRRIDVTYRNVPALAFRTFGADVLPLMPDRYGPLRSDGKGANLGYLFAVPARAAHVLLERLGVQEGRPPTEIIEASLDAPAETQRTALVNARLGQGKFRLDVLARWGGRCAVTGAATAELLRASHIKPWCDSDNRERLDPHNGLLLLASYDAAFDAGLITFTEQGSLVLSSRLPEEEARRCGIELSAKITGLRPEAVAYLAYHRTECFEP